MQTGGRVSESAAGRPLPVAEEQAKRGPCFVDSGGAMAAQQRGETKGWGSARWRGRALVEGNHG